MKSERRGKFGERKEKQKVLIFAVLFATLAFVSVGCASADTIYVPEEGNQTIQQAVNNATEGDTIIVRGGTYTENVNVNVNYLTIKSENGSVSTIIDGGGSGDVVLVTADYVNISGFTITNSSEQEDGIFLNGANYCNISNNILSNTFKGIMLQRSKNNTLTNNGYFPHGSRTLLIGKESICKRSVRNEKRIINPET